VLFEFVTLNHDALVAKARDKITTRPWPPASALEIENGVPLFLTQLTEALKRQSSPAPFSSTDIGIAATQHGRDLFEQGFTVSQVVHDYGAICQAVTELADEQDVPIAASEFQTLNGCLDAAIADAVTEHARITAAGPRLMNWSGSVRTVRGSSREGPYRLGLGLSIARKAVRAQNGDVTLRNIPGTGCIFTIDVPLATLESVPAAVRLP
jgi:hypothetical protein